MCLEVPLRCIYNKLPREKKSVYVCVWGGGFLVWTNKLIENTSNESREMLGIILIGTHYHPHGDSAQNTFPPRNERNISTITHHTPSTLKSFGKDIHSQLGASAWLLNKER